ncbi:unnamed protein product [Arabis nemorensis]|uniref:Squalene monooxygenase n=1 Tax=Arabis nemorensis TaxID=586526 RepID=A0A565CUZ3_9BRAS|nr:unnamed protein product [Arabis nemorensis]
MDMALPYLWLWTLLAFVLMWTLFHVAKLSKKKSKLADAAVEDRRDSGADVIIVGAGVGGSALAYALAKDGRTVHVIERDMREPERIMGEIMQPGGRFMLAKLGLEADQVSLGEGFSWLCAVGCVPLAVCHCQPVRLEEGTVKSLIEENRVIKGVTYKTSTGQETTAFAPLTVVCDGCYSNLRRSLIDNNAEVLSYGAGYISKNCRLEEPETVHLIMSKPTFTLLYQISSNEVRCVSEVSPDNVLSISNGEMTTFFKKTIAPQVRFRPDE